MKVAVLRETAGGERRVALVPDAVTRLRDAGFELAIEAGAGLTAGFADDASVVAVDACWTVWVTSAGDEPEKVASPG